MLIWIAQILICLGFIFEVICFWKENRKEILKINILASFLYALSYLLTGATTGFLATIINIIRTSVCYKNKNKLIIILLILLYAIVSLFDYTGWFCILPILAGIVFTICIYQENTFIMRLGQLIACFLWIIYNIFAGVYLLALTTSIIFISTFISMLNHNLN